MMPTFGEAVSIACLLALIALINWHPRGPKEGPWKDE
jgi:hypothetical protein